MDTIPDSVLLDLFSYLSKTQIEQSLVALDRNTSDVIQTPGLWKLMVETLIGWRLPDSAIEDWKTVYNILSKVKTGEHFLTAVSKGYTEVVKVLLTDPRVDPDDNNNYAIQLASENGHTEVVKLLLAHPKIPLSDKLKMTNTAIDKAVYLSSTLLLKHIDVDISKQLLTKARRSRRSHNLFWWCRLEKLHMIPSKAILLMDVDSDPLELCMQIESK